MCDVYNCIFAFGLCLFVDACACADTQYGLLPTRVWTNLRRGEEWLGRVLIIPPTPDAPRFCTSRGVCLGLNERRKECRLNGSDVESKVTGMASSILGTAENFPQILAFCVTYAKSLLCFFKVTQPRHLTVFILCNKGGGPSPPSYVKKKMGILRPFFVANGWPVFCELFPGKRSHFTFCGRSQGARRKALFTKGQNEVWHDYIECWNV